MAIRNYADTGESSAVRAGAHGVSRL